MIRRRDIFLGVGIAANAALTGINVGNTIKNLESKRTSQAEKQTKADRYFKEVEKMYQLLATGEVDIINFEKQAQQIYNEREQWIQTQYALSIVSRLVHIIPETFLNDGLWRQEKFPDGKNIIKKAMNYKQEEIAKNRPHDFA